MGLVKAKIVNVSVEPPAPIEVLFNPTDYGINRGANYTELQVPGLSTPILQFIRGEARTIDLELFLDGTLPFGDKGHTQSAQQYIETLSTTSGLPHVMVKRDMAKIHYALTHLDEILNGLTRGLDLSILDTGMGEQFGTKLAFFPTAAIFDARTLQSTAERGARAGFDGHKKKNGSKVHVAVDTLGHLLALKVTPANQQERDLVADLAKRVQRATDYTVEVAFVD